MALLDYIFKTEQVVLKYQRCLIFITISNINIPEKTPPDVEEFVIIGYATSSSQVGHNRCWRMQNDTFVTNTVLATNVEHLSPFFGFGWGSVTDDLPIYQMVISLALLESNYCLCATISNSGHYLQ